MKLTMTKTVLMMVLVAAGVTAALLHHAPTHPAARSLSPEVAYLLDGCDGDEHCITRIVRGVCGSVDFMFEESCLRVARDECVDFDCASYDGDWSQFARDHITRGLGGTWPAWMSQPSIVPLGTKRVVGGIVYERTVHGWRQTKFHVVPLNETVKDFAVSSVGGWLASR